VNPRRPAPKVSIYKVRDRRKARATANPFVLDWRVGGRQHSRSFPGKLAAEQFRSDLYAALTANERFDEATGQPESWHRAEIPTLVGWCRAWLAGEWGTWAPRTRRAAVEALSYVVPAALHGEAPVLSAKDARALRAHLVATLPPAPKGLPVDPFGEPYVPRVDERLERFLAQWSPRLDDLDRLGLAAAEQRLAVRADGSPRGSSFARYVKIARQCLDRAVELGLVATNPWPPRAKGHSHRKAVRKAAGRGGGPSVDTALLPSPAQFARMRAAMVSHQPASRQYRVMCEVMFYAGLRPSEVVDLCVEDLRLIPAADGFGEIHVRRADVGLAEPGDPKTSPRRVPIPPVLLEALAGHVARLGADEGFLFRTRTGTRPAASNWWRLLRRACVQSGVPPLRVYDLRHACATNWLHAGLSPGDCAMRLGHSVETLHRYYVGVLAGDVEANNARIAAYLAESTGVEVPHLRVVGKPVRRTG